MLEVTVTNNNIEKALRLLKKKIKDSKLLIELREKEFYRKPSEIKREKVARAKIRNRREEERENKGY